MMLKLIRSLGLSYFGEERYRRGLRNIRNGLTLKGQVAGGGDGQSLFSNLAVVTVTAGQVAQVTGEEPLIPRCHLEGKKSGVQAERKGEGK